MVSSRDPRQLHELDTAPGNVLIAYVPGKVRSRLHVQGWLAGGRRERGRGRGGGGTGKVAGEAKL